MSKELRLELYYDLTVHDFKKVGFETIKHGVYKIFRNNFIVNGYIIERNCGLPIVEYLVSADLICAWIAANKARFIKEGS